MTTRSAEDPRRARLKAALRENLKRRKGQALARDRAGGVPEAERAGEGSADRDEGPERGGS